MERKLLFLSLEATAYVELEKLKTQRMEMESQPPPAFDKESIFEALYQGEKEFLESEFKGIIGSIVQTSDRAVAVSFSPELLIEEAKKVYRKEAGKLALPYLMLQGLQGLRDGLQSAVEGRVRGEWQNRCSGVDEMIGLWGQKIPKRFSPDMINTETMAKLIPQGPDSKALRFPVDRCKQVDGKWADAWLQDALHCRPVMFDSPQYIEKLMEVHALYLAEAKKEQQQQQAAPPPPPQERQAEAQQETIPANELRAMAEHREDLDYGMRELRRRGRI